MWQNSLVVSENVYKYVLQRANMSSTLTIVKTLMKTKYRKLYRPLKSRNNHVLFNLRVCYRFPAVVNLCV